MEEYCPDRESSGSSEEEEEREVCMICLRASTGEWVYPCDCPHGIAIAHRACFDSYRNSWPVDHPNRSVCPYCQASYEYDLVVQDMSHHRHHGYVVCYTAAGTAVFHTLFVLFFSPLFSFPSLLPLFLSSFSPFLSPFLSFLSSFLPFPPFFSFSFFFSLIMTALGYFSIKLCNLFRKKCYTEIIRNDVKTCERSERNFLYIFAQFLLKFK